MRDPPAALASKFRLLPLLSGIVLLGVIAIIATTVLQGRKALLGAARVEARNLSQVLEAQTGNILQSVDATLQGVAGIWAHMPPSQHADARAMHSLLGAKAREEEAIRAIYILDQRGRMIHDSASYPSRTLDFSDREYFLRHGKGPSHLFVSPMMRGRLTGRWGMVLSRPLFDRQGGLDGVVVAALEPRDLEQPFGSLHIGSGGFISLHHLEGSTVLRVPNLDGAIGRADTDLLRASAMLKPGAYVQSEGTLRGKAYVYATRRLLNYPMVVTVALDPRDVLAGWRRSAVAYTLVALVFVVSVIGLTRNLMHEVRRREVLLSALRHSEEEVRRHRDHLQDAVAERTVELTRAKDAAEKASAAKSEFLSNVSHELRTPMHVILSFATLGLEQTKAGKAPLETIDTYLSRIRANGERLLHLLNDLLDLSKLEAARMRYNFRAQGFLQVLTPVLGEMEALAGARKLRVAVSNQAVDDTVYGDAVRLQQVMRNLLTNAVKFSPADGQIDVLLTQGVLPQDPDSPSTPGQAGGAQMLEALEISVSDQGDGIPEDEFESIFDKFVQSSKTKSGAGGTGLGLAICREIVSHHGGQIWAGNRVEGGAVFTIVLPRGPVPGHPLHTRPSETAQA